MATFRLETEFDQAAGVPQSPLWNSLESIEGIVNKALPDLKCPICGDNHFTIMRNFRLLTAPQINIHAWGAPTPVRFTPSLTMYCDDCGHFLFFAEEELVRRAERMK